MPRIPFQNVDYRHVHVDIKKSPGLNTSLMKLMNHFQKVQNKMFCCSEIIFDENSTIFDY